MKSDIFSFNLLFDVLKSEDKKNEEMRIGGYASTSDEDRQGDEIIQKGLDISEFVNFGFFNYDHKSEMVLGYPDKDKCRIDSKGLYVEGTLLDIPLAKSIWETAIALKKSNAPRKLGFSVEGKVLDRNSLGQIIKAKIYNVAITYNPVNTSCTWDALVKSFTTDTQEVDKSLQAGFGDSNGSPIMPESLDSAFKTLSYTVGEGRRATREKRKLKDQISKQDELTKAEKILYLQVVKGLSYYDAKSLIE